MVRIFDEFEVNIKNEVFNKEHISYPRTATLTFFDSEGKELKTVDFGFMDDNEILGLIVERKDLIFDYCYIRDFSFTKFRNYLDFSEADDAYIINNFSATGAFFDSKNKTNEEISFSKLKFSGNQLYFNNCVFIGCPINFSKSKFLTGDINFEYVLFGNGNVDFSESVFSEGDISFKNAIFKEGVKNFENIEFGKGEVSFINTDFGKGNISFSNTNFNDGRTTFRVAHFGTGKKEFNHTRFGIGEVTFEKTEFHDGEVSFRSADFHDCKVDFTRSEFGRGEISFINTLFGNGNVYFTGVDFNHGKVNFKLAEFGKGNKDFHYAKFGEGDIIFERTKFGDGILDFRAVDFHEGRIAFNRTEFGNGDIIFEASELKKGSISFKNSVFGNGFFNFEMAVYDNAELVIDDVDFGLGKVSFKRSKFGTMILKSCQINNYFDLRVEKCDKLDLSNTVVKDIIDIHPHDFKSDIKQFDLSGIRLLGRIYFDWRENNVKELIYQQNSSFRNKSEQFRVLKQNYNATGQYNDEDEAYVEFKRTELIANFQENEKKGGIDKIGAYVNYFFQRIVFDRMGLYATNPVRVLISMLVVYLFFSITYITLQYTTDVSVATSLPDQAGLSIVERSLYYSAVTFFTIGYGDFYPSGFIRWIASFEGFCGVFLMSYFTVAFVRKILR